MPGPCPGSSAPSFGFGHDLRRVDLVRLGVGPVRLPGLALGREGVRFRVPALFPVRGLLLQLALRLLEALGDPAARLLDRAARLVALDVRSRPADPARLGGGRLLLLRFDLSLFHSSPPFPIRAVRTRRSRLRAKGPAQRRRSSVGLAARRAERSRTPPPSVVAGGARTALG